MENIKQYILSQVASHQLSKEEAKELLIPIMNSEQTNKDVAIIGIASKFPNSNNPDEFWELVKSGTNCIQDYPDQRKKDFEDFLENPSYTEFVLGKKVNKKDSQNVHAKAGYLEEIDKFDSNFFGIPPNEAIFMDPQQRLSLEVAWEAMEDAGYGGDTLIGSNTAVFIGKDGTNYSYYKNSSEGNPLQLTGSWESLMPSRISFLFDFKGPSMIVDTACSAGLVSVHMATQSLLNNECDYAIAGGINLSFGGEFKPEFQGDANLGEVESISGQVRTFDSKASGTVWGEGVGLVLIKRLEDAIRDKDNIQAIIKGSSINNDGASSSITAPNAETQEEVITNAWEKAAINPETITYMEAHGTGTVLGDPIEIKGLTSSFNKYTNKKQFCAIGSLKTNMGHLVGASGIASLIKIVKSMEHQELAPTINFETPNPYINFLNSPLYINTKLTRWEESISPRRAALSSFGFSRTNCHMVLEEPPSIEDSLAYHNEYCLTISAKNEEVLNKYINNYLKFLTKSKSSFENICYTSNIGRGHYTNRLIVRASSKNDLITRLQALQNLKINSDFSFIGTHKVIKENRTNIKQGEITKTQQNTLTNEANNKINQYVSSGSNDTSLLNEICELYIGGANINWKLFYQDEKRRRVSLPVYPLQRVRHWAPIKKSKVIKDTYEKMHSLVEREIITTHPESEFCFETALNIDKHWVLSDHKINGKAVLPGTSYIEMARFAASRIFNTDAMKFESIYFLTPIVLNEDQTTLTRINFYKTRTGGLEFNIKSLDSSKWVTNVEGHISMLREESLKRKHINLLKEQAFKIDDDYVFESKTKVFQFGEHWNTIKKIWRFEGSALGLLKLPDSLKEELNEFKLHPSILDNAVNLISQDTEDTFLPYMYKSINFYAGFSNTVYSHVKGDKANSWKNETMSYDIEILDEMGNVLVEILGYTVKRLNSTEFLDAPVTNKLLRLDWIKRNNDQKVELQPINWGLIITKEQKVESFIRDNYKDISIFYLDESNLLQDKDTFEPSMNGISKLINAAEKKNVTGIIFATDFTINTEEIHDFINFESSLTKRKSLGVEALFYLCKNLLISESKQIGTIKVLTKNAIKIDGRENVINPLGNSSLSLANVIKQEYKHFKVNTLDVSDHVQLSTIFEEINYDRSIAMRESGNFEPILVNHIEERSQRPLEDGVYIISGGLGGLGLSIAENLSLNTNNEIILLGRRNIAPKKEWEELSKTGHKDLKMLYKKLVTIKQNAKRVEYIQIDISDNSSVELIKEVAPKSITGIFHAAGLAGDGYLLLKEEEDFNEVLSVKINGSLNLMKLVPEDSNSFLILFSSITSLTGGEGQGDYSAANAFMDSLSDYAINVGKNVITINWPNWEEIGMAVKHNVNLQESLFNSMSPKQGMEWIESIIAKPAKRVIPTTINNNVIADYLEDIPFNISEDILKTKSVITYDSEIQPEKDIFILGEDNPSESQLKIAKCFSSILGLSEIDIYLSFQEMGGNSLMATQLLKKIDKVYPGIIDISDLFSYPTINELAGLIDNKSGAFSKQLKHTSGKSVEEGHSSITNLIKEELSGTEFLDEFIHLLDEEKLK
ncbi:SDR family NAD(P)-dependent oxidoreductase [Shouchella hunanensis]|uniref:SDR family NAD(P)-dependent oxidoreductase n=1 Tax=Shouchella hunanensis TaxID=766894 RepID=A0ABY7W0S5_9BACI|nr:SDR family NAD(P)-dependent oxidoreductase [Shouchella hunanensis]WDF02034.1 SDR family NAD(P)-dependent oxidoreductase [Shouchella hunanensis]